MLDRRSPLDGYSLQSAVLESPVDPRPGGPVRPLDPDLRLRFPTSIWGTPFIAHEFGHFLSTRLVDTYGEGPPEFPFREMLTREGRDSEHPYAEKHLGELFSDLFATYTLVGPRFAYEIGIFRRFHPRRRPWGVTPTPGMMCGSASSCNAWRRWTPAAGHT